MSRSVRILALLILSGTLATVSFLIAREDKEPATKAPADPGKGLLPARRFVHADDKKPDDKPPDEIKKAPGSIAIDGDLDKPAWKAAKPIEVKYIWNDKEIGKVSNDPRMIARYTWDDEYLYIGYETFDKNLVALGKGEKKGPKDNQREVAEISHPTKKVDVVEFFISFGDTRFFWEIHHNALNHFNDIWCIVPDDKWPISKSSLNPYGIWFGTRELIDDDPAAGATLKTAVKLKPKADGKPSTVNDPSDVDTGYFGELRLPWKGLGAPMACRTTKTIDGKKQVSAWKMDGQEMMILAVFQDGDLKDHYHHSSPTKGGGWFHKGAEHYPKYVLKD